MTPFFVTIPHSGEDVPPEASWLQGFPEETLFRDVDRYVDRLYEPALTARQIPSIVARFHRYAVDLNRVPADVDQDSVQGSVNPSGTFPLGFHWVQTTYGERLMKTPISKALHQQLCDRYFDPFHQKVREQFALFFKQGASQVFHLDAHSMPSKGTAAHRDSGNERPQIVVSDQDGASCRREYVELVRAAYEAAGFQVAYNWPYKGGRITQVYGQPSRGQHTLQVEMNRSLYMNEESKALRIDLAAGVQKQLDHALNQIFLGIKNLGR